jgi:hypothetical protein
MSVMERPATCRCGQRCFGDLDVCKTCYSADQEAAHTAHDNRTSWRVCFEPSCLDAQARLTEAGKVERGR